MISHIVTEKSHPFSVRYVNQNKQNTFLRHFFHSLMICPQQLDGDII
ncbi:hypothetical protein pah_c261o002 [Parachlamydia acanthamoebae str. Hall's coccus]|nr:hypothetical protein pah_c261o002 [Parachlamydia acanthamoebae str. Hall's coccus]